MTPKKQREATHKILAYLRPFVTGTPNFGKINKRAKIKVPPLLGIEGFKLEEDWGIPSLSNYMVLEVSENENDIAETFSMLVYSKINPESMADTPVWGLLHKSVKSFCKGRLERFIVWAGSQKGWELSVSSTHLTASNGEETFGVVDGDPVCRYSEMLSGSKIDLDFTGITTPQEVMVYDPALILMYGRLNREPELQALLGAVATVNGNKLSTLAAWLFIPNSGDLSNKLTKLVINGLNPTRRICDHLVPNFFNRRVFYRTFGSPSTWVCDPSTRVRSNMYEKLKTFGLVGQ